MKPRNNPSPAEQLMQVQEQAAIAVAGFTGVKAQFIAAGWTPEAAEQMTLELFKQGGAQ